MARGVEAVVHRRKLLNALLISLCLVERLPYITIHSNLNKPFTIVLSTIMSTHAIAHLLTMEMDRLGCSMLIIILTELSQLPGL